jgi:hypothetical protein
MNDATFLTWLNCIDVTSKVVTGLAGLAVSFLLYRLNVTNHKRLLRQQQLEKELSLDIKMSTDITQRRPDLAAVVHVRIEIKNISKERWCIPAVYLSVRAVPKDASMIIESEFDDLPLCDPLPDGRNICEIPNLAFVPNTIKHLSPDEIEIVTCTLQVPATFIEKHPVVALRSRIFAAGGRELGPRYLHGNCRDDWLKFVQSEGNIRNSYCFMERWPIGEPPPASEEPTGIHPGRWYLVQPPPQPGQQGAADLENTKRFVSVLKTINRWHQYSTINLSENLPSQNSDAAVGQSEPLALRAA